MAKIERERVSYYIIPAAAKTVRRLAKSMGYVNTAGRGAGRANVGGFMEGIASGEVVIIARALAHDLAAIAAQLDYESLEAWLLEMTDMSAPGPLGTMPWVARHIYESAGPGSPEMVRIRELEREMMAMVRTILQQQVDKLLPKPEGAVVQESVP